MTTEGYAAVMSQLRDVAARHGALALVTEGGYELTALAACLDASIAAIEGSSASSSVRRRCRRARRASREPDSCALASFWPAC